MIEDPITADPCEEMPEFPPIEIVKECADPSAPRVVAVLSGVLLFVVVWATIFVVMGWVL